MTFSHIVKISCQWKCASVCMIEDKMYLIAFEGLDFSGKSTLKKILGQALKERGIPICETFEPGDTALGEQLRQILLNKWPKTPHQEKATQESREKEDTSKKDAFKEGKVWKNKGKGDGEGEEEEGKGEGEDEGKEDGEGKTTGLCGLAELFLMLADRSNHVEKKIRPALSKGEWVLCDRFTASSIAFQGAGRSLGEERVKELSFWATGGLEPNLTILLDLNYETTLKRRSAQTSPMDRIEKERKGFHQKVRNSYLKQAKANQSSWLTLNANLPPKQLLEKVVEYMEVKKWL